MCPGACSSVIAATLSAGKTSAITSSEAMPTCAATPWAARRLSPVNSTGPLPGHDVGQPIEVRDDLAVHRLVERE